MMQKFTSSSDGGDGFALARLSGDVAFFGVPFLVLPSWLLLSGEVTPVLSLALRMRFVGFFGLAQFLLCKINKNLVASDRANGDRDVDGSSDFLPLRLVDANYH